MLILINFAHLSKQQYPLCHNIHIDFYNEETQTQSKNCDPNNKIKNSEEIKVDYYDEKSEVLNEQKIEFDRKSKLAKSKHQIDLFKL